MRGGEVIGHHVEDDAQPVRVGTLDEGSSVVEGAVSRVDAAWIGDVVAAAELR